MASILTYVALVRGINVGRAKRVAMADLRAMLEGLGFRDVRTLLNSGNVVFTAPKSAPVALAERIEEALTRKLRVTARVTVMSASELQAAVDGVTLRTEGRDPARLIVGFFRAPADERRVSDILRQTWDHDELAIGPRVIYVWCPGGLLESRAIAAIGRAAGDGVTTRNWSTVTKLLDMVKGRPA
jgi:uncharacterized protein (DUF1697 family)